MSVPGAGSRVHIVAIGGSGMSAIARILLARGCIVSGSDSADSQRMHQLAAEGAHVFHGHDGRQVLDTRPDVVIHSPAVGADNPEIAAARTIGIPVLTRTEALSSLMADRDVIEVAGTHGKTTTSSMLACAAREVGRDPSFLVGSEIAQFGTNAHWAESLTIVEGDESDASAFTLRPRILVVTNIDADHMDFWGTAAEMERAFADFACEALPATGALVTCADDPGARRLAERVREAGRCVITYGGSADSDLVIEATGHGTHGPRVAITGIAGAREMSLRVPGWHNVLNASAVLCVAYLEGWPINRVVSAVSEFSGTRRRFEPMASTRGIEVIDDYAHHPTAVAATLAAAQGIARMRRDAGRPSRVVAVCQPYRWYRTAAFTREYAAALDNADQVLLLDVFGPGEEPIPGAGPEAIAAMLSTPHAYLPSKAAAVRWAQDNCRDGDLVLTLGGEDVRTLAHDLAEWVGRDEPGRT